MLASMGADDWGFTVFGIVWFSVGVGMGYWIGLPRGRGLEGAILGLFAPLGWLVTWCLPRTLDTKARHLVALERAMERERASK